MLSVWLDQVTNDSWSGHDWETGHLGTHLSAAVGIDGLASFCINMLITLQSEYRTHYTDISKASFTHIDSKYICHISYIIMYNITYDMWK